MVLQSKIFYLWFKIKKQKGYRMVFPKNGDIWKLIKFSIQLSGSVRKSRENYRQIYGKTKASLWRNLSTVTAPKIFKDNLLLCSFSLQLIFFSEQPFYGNYSTLDSNTNTAISHTFAYSSRWRRKPWQGLLPVDFGVKQFSGSNFLKSEFSVSSFWCSVKVCDLPFYSPKWMLTVWNIGWCGNSNVTTEQCAINCISSFL